MSERDTIEQMIRRLHHYGDPPDPRLQEDVDADVLDILDRVDALVTAAERRGAEKAIGAIDEDMALRIASAFQTLSDRLPYMDSEQDAAEAVRRILRAALFPEGGRRAERSLDRRGLSP